MSAPHCRQGGWGDRRGPQTLNMTCTMHGWLKIILLKRVTLYQKCWYSLAFTYSDLLDTQIKVPYENLKLWRRRQIRFFQEGKIGFVVFMLQFRYEPIQLYLSPTQWVALFTDHTTCCIYHMLYYDSVSCLQSYTMT